MDQIDLDMLRSETYQKTGAARCRKLPKITCQRAVVQKAEVCKRPEDPRGRKLGLGLVNAGSCRKPTASEGQELPKVGTTKGRNSLRMS
ncbi:hypothetical protein J6590_071923 [Homalodisca vitripennis]|nr:hypothetical protein J6590_071923 [Homalodisca vitripennis]